MIDNTEPIREFDKDIVYNKINELYPFPLNDKKVKINELFMEIDKPSSKNDIDKYKEKLKIWKDEELSPLQTQYLFKIDNFDKKLVLSISPQTEDEKTEYFKWLVDYLNNVIYDKFKKEFDFKLIKTKELVTNRNINQIKLLVKFKLQSKNVYRNHKTFKKENFLLSELKLNNHTDLIYTIQITALEIAFVLNELEAIYILENKISINYESNNETNYNEYLILKNRTFNSNLSKETLIEVYNFLENDYILSNDYSKELFIKLFSNSKISDFKKEKIIWVKQWGKSINTIPILKLFRILCNPKEKFYDYHTEIGNVVTMCFKFEHIESEINEITTLKNFKDNISENIYNLMEKDTNNQYDHFEIKLLNILN